MPMPNRSQALESTPEFDQASVFAQVSDAKLHDLLAAGREVRECLRVLRKAGLNVVGEVLRGQGDFVELEHYPGDDVFDADSHSQYYYHSHRSDSGEHGHFHTFLRATGMPADARPITHAGSEPWPLGDDALSHLIAISMDDYGEPIGLFTVNRWVCGDTWYAAADVIRMLPAFRIDHAYPSWPTNRWLGAMLALFAPHISRLIQVRDAVVAAWQAQHPESDVFEDRGLEITSYMPVSVDAQIEAIEVEMTRRQRA